MKKIKVERFISFTLTVVMMFGLFAGVPVSANDSAVSNTITIPTYSAGWSVIGIKTNGSVWVQSRGMDSPPQQISGISNAKEVAIFAGDFGSEAYYILKTDNTLWRYTGYEGSINNDSKKVKDNIIHFTVQGYSISAIDINNNLWVANDTYSGSDFHKVMSDVVDVTGRGRFALKIDGTVWDVQNNTQIMEGVVEIVSNSYGKGLYALKPDGSLWIWGESSFNYGNAGIAHYEEAWWGEDEDYISHYDFNIPYCFEQNVDSMSIGTFGLLVKKNNNTMWLWRRTDPAKQIDIGSDIVHFSCADGTFGGNDYAVFMKSDGSVWAFGDENYDSGWPFHNQTPTKVMEGIKLPGSIPGSKAAIGGETGDSNKIYQYLLKNNADLLFGRYNFAVTYVDDIPWTTVFGYGAANAADIWKAIIYGTFSGTNPDIMSNIAEIYMNNPFKVEAVLRKIVSKMCNNEDFKYFSSQDKDAFKVYFSILAKKSGYDEIKEFYEFLEDCFKGGEEALKWASDYSNNIAILEALKLNTTSGSLLYKTIDQLIIAYDDQIIGTIKDWR